MKASWVRLETVAVATIAVFSTSFLVQTYEYGRRAALFPRLISLTILCLTAIFVVARLRGALKRKTSPAPAAQAREGVGSEDTRPGGINWLVALSAALGFSVLIYLVGFGPSTFLYVATHVYLTGYRRHTVIFLFALAMAVIVIVTGYLFDIQLPEGALIHRITGEG